MAPPTSSPLLTRRLGVRLLLSVGVWGGWPRLAEPAAASLSLIVIAHPGVSFTRLAPAELANLYRGGRRSWPDGSPAVVFNMPAQSPARVEFDRVVLKMTPSEAAQFWIDRRIRGDGLPPRQLPSPALAVRIVQAMAGAIAYVPEATAVGPARIVARVRDGQVVSS